MNQMITKKDVKKIIRKKPMPKALEKGFIQNGWEDALDRVYDRTAELFADNASAGKGLRMHLEQLLPCIAFYEVLQERTGSKDSALDFVGKWAFVEVEKMIPIAQAVMKLGLYRKMPDICEVLLHKMFGEDAGFESQEVPGAKKFARDMTLCPYHETCKKYGCPELTQFACKADDLTYGDLHPKLVWGRTQTLGMGGECCDFRLYLKEEG